MKLKINENRYLLEDITAVKKYYPSIDDDTFMQLIELDPTYRDGSNSLGKYGKWILNLYNKGAISEEDFSEIRQLLQQFTTYRNRIQNKDLNAYKSLQDLSDTLAAVIDDDSMLSPRQKVRFLKNVKAGRVKISAEDDYDVVLETPKFIVYVPNTHEASMKLGKGTKWCTAHENPDWYNKYTDGGGKLYIIQEKPTGKRWQYSDSRGDFLDQDDNEFNKDILFKADEKLAQFLYKLLGLNDSGEFIYDGSKKVPNGIDKVIVSGTVEYIKEGAFSFSNVKDVKIEYGVEGIDECAFQSCEQLKTINLPDSITYINKRAFEECYALNEIELPNKLQHFGSHLFFSSAIETISIPNSITEIPNSSFRNCGLLREISLPRGLLEIHPYAFYRCRSLEYIDIPDGVIKLGRSAFGSCHNLASVTIPESVDVIDSEAFRSCYSLKEIIFPSGLTDIYTELFAFCDNLTNVVFPRNLQAIWSSAFNHCSNLYSIKLPENVIRIGENAFESCYSLESAYIPNSVKYIGDDAFYGCNSLVIYTDNDYVLDYCMKNSIRVKSAKEFKNESMRKPFRKLKLRIEEK